MVSLEGPINKISVPGIHGPVPGFEIFLGSAPVQSQVSKFFLVLVLKIFRSWSGRKTRTEPLGPRPTGFGPWIPDQFYGICGKKYTQPINKSDLDAACDKAFQRCSTNYDTQCARDSIIGLYFTITQFNSCVFFCRLKDKRVFFALLGSKGGSFEPINFFSKIFFTGSLTGSQSEIHRFEPKENHLTRRPKLYEFRQYPNTISFCYVLVVQSKTLACLLKDEKGRICYSKKEDATVK